MKLQTNKGDFPIICVGGSAGRLDAYTRLLMHMPSDLGVAIVIVNHMRRIPTLLHQILPRYTDMLVHLISERLVIQPNQVFVIPSNRDLHVVKATSSSDPFRSLGAGQTSLPFSYVRSPRIGTAKLLPSSYLDMTATVRKHLQK